MHRIAFIAETAERGARPDGRATLAQLDPRRTAHLVVDLQRGFMAPGAPVEVPEARHIVANVNRISAALRAAGGVNVFLRMNLATDATARWRDYIDHLGARSDRDLVIAAFSPGAPEFDLWDDLEVTGDDLVVDKCRFSAFIPGASRLHDELSGRGIDTLFITGTLTNVCCESTARDAMQMDYRVRFVADATAALSDQTHNATLANIDGHFGRVVLTDDVVGALAPAAAAGARSA